LARRLRDGPRDAEHRHYAMAALKWDRAHTGPLAKVLLSLELFEDLDGRPVTLGAVADEHARGRSIAVAHRGLPRPEGLVLADDGLTRSLLARLEYNVEDVTNLLQKKQALAELRRERRLSRLSVDGDAWVRVQVNRDGVRGELALLRAAARPQPLTLAKDGVAVCPYDVEGKLPVSGVVDSPDLAVGDDWLSARPDAKLQTLIAEHVEALYLALARRAEKAGSGEREPLRDLTLQFLSHRGMNNAAAFGRMTGAAEALARVPLFQSQQGEWLTLAALAEHVMRGEKVGILARRLLAPDVGDALVLRAERLDDPWLGPLKEVLGPASLEKIDDVGRWQRVRAEADPATGTPAMKALTRLRKQLRLLRAGALGRLTPDELEDVRLSTASLERRVEYDPARKLLLLDGNDPQVLAALEEAAQRPERLWVLLAACYGEVNRALERITDAHEADLLAALAVHLASNPEHLAPAAATTEKGPE
jgi:hypothetical protein